MFDEKIIKAIQWWENDYWFIALNPDGTNISNSEPFNLSVSQGKKSWYSWIDKFWKNDDIDTSTAPEDIWDQGWLYNFTVNTGAEYYVSSDNNSDTQELLFDTLTIDSNWNWNREEFLFTINWQTKTKIISPSWDLFVRVLRIISNADFWNDIQWNVYTYEDSTVTSGIPTDTTKIRAKIIWSRTAWMSNNQTKMNIFTIPTGKVWFLIRGEAGIWKTTSSTDQAEMQYVSRRFWKVFTVKKDFTLMTSWSTVYKDTRSLPDPIPAKTDILLRCSTVSSNNISAWGAFDVLLVDENLLSDDYLNSIWQIRKV